MCLNFVVKKGLRKFFSTENFPIYGIVTVEERWNIAYLLITEMGICWQKCTCVKVLIMYCIWYKTAA